MVKAAEEIKEEKRKDRWVGKTRQIVQKKKGNRKGRATDTSKRNTTQKTKRQMIMQEEAKESGRLNKAKRKD